MDSEDAVINDKTASSEGQCFYTLCLKTKCCGCLPCGKFKDRKHALYCYVFSAMITCLLVAVIGPLVSFE